MQAFLLLILLADTSPKGPKTIQPEDLGSQWTQLAKVEVMGLKARVWKNLTKNREEVWYQHPTGEWFIQVRKDTFVLAIRQASGVWRTNPKTRVVRHKGSWWYVSPDKKKPLDE